MSSTTLQGLSTLEGFAGAALFTPGGQLLAAFGGDAQLEAVGELASTVLLTAKRASLDTGAGRGHQVHVSGEKAQVLVRCLNEGSDPLASQPGKAHLHLVVVLAPGASVEHAQLRMGASLRELAETHRG